MIAAVPSVTFAGLTVSPGDANDPKFGAVVVEGLAIRYGRSSPFEQPAPGSATVSFVVSEGKEDFLLQPAGKALQVIIPTGAGNRTVFRGTVDTARVRFWKVRKLDGKKLFRFECTVVDPMAQISEMTQFQGLTRPQETATARLVAIENQILSNYPGLINGLGGGSAYPYSLRTEEQSGSLLDQLAAIYTTVGEVLWYDAGTNRLEAAGHRHYRDITGGPLEMVAVNGKYACTAAGNPGRALRSKDHRVEALDDAKADKESAIRGIQVQGKLFDTNTSKEVDWNVFVTAGGGVSTLQVDSKAYTVGPPYSQVGMQATGNLWAEIANDNAGLQHPPIRAVFRDGFDNTDAVNFWLAGREQRLAFFVGGSAYSALKPGKGTFVRTIGGTIAYRRQHGGELAWEAEMNLAPVAMNYDTPPVTCANVNPSYATTPVRLADLDDTVTCEALGFTGKGI
jgi:hypothetical protein